VYERDIENFCRSLLGDAGFVSSLEQFLRDNRVVERGRRNSLAQAALLLTCPGIPDVYQGCELWDMSLVDPDNRRPVDYALRSALLRRSTELPTLRIADDAEGVSKLWLTRRLLEHRRANPDVYAKGGYEPLPTSTTGLVCYERDSLAVVAPCRSTVEPDATVKLPAGGWVELLTGAEVRGGKQPLGPLLSRFPVAVLERAR